MILKNTLSILLFTVAVSPLADAEPKTEQRQESDSISVIELNQKFKQAPQGQVLIDVRTAEEWKQVHATPALHLPMDQVSESALQKLSVKKDDPIYVICAAGGRSSKVANTLRQLGYSKVWNVSGGTNAWVEAKLPTTH